MTRNLHVKWKAKALQHLSRDVVHGRLLRGKRKGIPTKVKSHKPVVMACRKALLSVYVKLTKNTQEKKASRFWGGSTDEAKRSPGKCKCKCKFLGVSFKEKLCTPLPVAGPPTVKLFFFVASGDSNSMMIQRETKAQTESHGKRALFL